MLSSQRFKTLLVLKTFTRTTPPTPNSNPIFPNFPSLFSLKYSTITSHQHSFTVSYLINKCGFSPETALKVSKQFHFDTPEKPDSVLAFFRNHGFSNSQMNSIIRKTPNLLACDPQKRVLPKFEFLLSKGASSSGIVVLVTKNTAFLNSSLENSIIPKYELARRFFQTDKKAIDCVMICPFFFSGDHLDKNVKMLFDEGVTHSNIGHLFRTRPSVLLSRDLRNAVDEVKELGFDPRKLGFSVALLAKRAMAKSRWDAKVDAFKRWGLSEGEIMEAFRSRPSMMLVSRDKINALMNFWVNQLGWNPLVVLNKPVLFEYSLEKRIVPRAFVVKYLDTKGFRKNNVSLCRPFDFTEEEFLEKYVKSFKEEASRLLYIYQEKLNLQDNREGGSI